MHTYRNKWAPMIGIVLVLLLVNIVTLPLFLYGSFGSDVILEYSPIEWMMNILLLAWIFFLTPNFPIVGLMVSVWRGEKKSGSVHLAMLFVMLIGGLFFYMGMEEEGRAWVAALVLTQVSGIASLILLWNQLFLRKT